MNTLSSILKFIGNRFERMQGGYVTAVEVPSNSYVDREVTFPKAYSAEPKVVACSATTSVYGAVGKMSWSVINVTNTGFTIRIYNADTQSRSPGMRWIAIP